MKNNHTITNSGEITVKGNRSIGVLVENGVTGVNDTSGIISVSGDGNILFDPEAVSTGAIGMKAKNGSLIINNGKIYGVGSRNRGLDVYDNSTAINNGTIDLESIIKYMEDIYIDEEGNEIPQKGYGYSMERGMLASLKSKVENNGTILGYGEYQGIRVFDESTGINNGDILLEGKYEKYYGEIINYPNTNHLISKIWGMRGTENSYLNNKGNIVIKDARASGMSVIASTAENNGNISLESLVYDPYRTATWIDGMIGVEESIVVNNKNINIYGRGTGIYVSEKSQATNNGNIYIKPKAI